MFLTKIKLNLSDRFVRDAISDGQAMHRFVLRMFDCKREDANVIYRFDDKKGVLYVGSTICPDSRKAGNCLEFTCRNVDDFIDTFKKGSVFLFNILVYPAKQHSGKRSFIVNQQERQDWLFHVGQKNGFRVISVDEKRQGSVSIKHRKESGGTFVQPYVEMSGALTVTDINTFINCYCKGLGRGLSYGLGMLLLGRAA